MSALRESVDLIITDLNMPNLDGYSLIETVRRNDKHRDTPIIILSSEEGDDDKARGLQVGANAYLVKPVERNSLIAAVKAQIAGRGKPKTTGK